MLALRVEAIITDNARVLLVQHPWLPAWQLPGGIVESHMDPAEYLGQLVEAQTGLQVRVGRLIGLYSRPNWRQEGDTTCLFSGLQRTRELLDKANRHPAYFSPRALPDNILPWQVARIQDALENQQRPFVRSQEMHWPFESECYDDVLVSLIQNQGLSPQEAINEAMDELGISVSEETIATWLRERSS
jgi:ADP-ribose pyrophosphatase YjhB (NUDIX family)